MMDEANESVFPSRELPVSGESVPAAQIPGDAEYWLALARLPGVGRKTFLNLIQAYKCPKAAWDHSDRDWQQAKLLRGGISTVSHRGEALAWAVRQIERLTASDWRLLVYGGMGYPRALATLAYPPPFLFTAGQLPPQPAIAIVGSRQCTEYGINVARQIASELAAAGVLIVSGFARGIDTAAHTAAVEAGGATVAVWGCGPDTIYPHENKSLVPRILECGGIVTEFPFGTAPEPQNFPVRNRLIAGLSAGVLVAQARQKSGALLTAQHALEQGKEVYAVPGEIGRPQSAGTNELIKQGARIVTDAGDILTDLGLRATRHSAAAAMPSRPLPPLTPLEHQVWDGLGCSACHIDRLAVSLKRSAAECAAVLLSLELKGIVRQAAGNMFSRVG